MRRTGEDFEKCDAGAPQFRDLTELSRPGVCREPEIDDRAVAQVFHFFAQEGAGSDRITMRVLDDGGDSTYGGGGAAGNEVFPCGIARVLEVHVPVDGAG